MLGEFDGNPWWDQGLGERQYVGGKERVLADLTAHVLGGTVAMPNGKALFIPSFTLHPVQTSTAK